MRSGVGRWPIFYLWLVMRSAPDSLTELIRTAVEPLGYELVGVELLSGRSRSTLRVYIDHEEGISADNCAVVSHQVSGVLDVEDPIQENYSLEISSPGLDRPLFFREDFDRFSGSRVRIKLRMKLQCRRHFEGALKGIQGDDVLVVVDDEEFNLPFEQIDKARLVPEF